MTKVWRLTLGEQLNRLHLLKSHKAVRSVLDSIYHIESVSSDDVFSLLGDLQFVKTHLAPDGKGALANLCERMQEQLAEVAQPNTEVSFDVRQTLRQRCEELRLIMIASALSVAPRANGDSEILMDAASGANAYARSA